MIFEALFNYRYINKHPHALLFVGFLYASLSLLLSLFVFKVYASIVMVLFTVMACMPIVYTSIKHEEHEDIVLKTEMSKLREHAKTLKKFIFLFLGFVLAFSFWFVVMPADITVHAFKAQTDTIRTINPTIETVASQSGQETLTANVIKDGFPIFMSILMNNVVVLIFCIVFSALFGFGAIFILSWNASVIGTAIGILIKNGFESYSHLIGMSKAFVYFQIISLGLFQYAFHGIPEIAAYFIAGLAGGIISVAVIKHDLRSKNFNKIIIDSFDLAIISIVLVIAAAFIEVYITPIIFF